MIGKIGRLKPDENAPPIVLIDKLGLDFLKPDFITNISERKWNALRCLYIPFCLIYFCCVLYLTIIIANIKPEVNHHPFLVDKLYGWWTGLALCLLEFAVLLYKFLCEYYRDVDSLKNIQEIPQNIREKCRDPQNMQKKCVITMEFPTSPRDFTTREQNSTKEKKRNLRYIIYDFTYNCRLNVIVLFLSYLAMYQIPQWQWIFVLLTIFSWWSLLNLITKIPSLGVYILVVRQVVNSFLLFLPVVIIFVLPFAALFHWLLAEKESEISENNNEIETIKQNMASLNFFNTFVQTLVMMIGEFDFKEAVAKKNSWMITSTFCVFLFIITILLMNLLTSIAVTDTSQLLETAVKMQKEARYNTIKQVEAILPTHFRKYFWFFCKILEMPLNCFLKLFIWYELPKNENEDPWKMLEDKIQLQLTNQYDLIQEIYTHLTLTRLSSARNEIRLKEIERILERNEKENFEYYQNEQGGNNRVEVLV